MLGHHGRTSLLLAGALLSYTGLARAARPQEAPIKAAAPGALVDTPSGHGVAEAVEFAPGLAPAMLTTAPGSTLRVDDWPVTPGTRRTVFLTRQDVYAPDARIVRVDGFRETEVPRSKLAFFSGKAEGDGSRLMVAVDPETGGFSGFTLGGDGFYELLPPAAGRKERHLLARPDDMRVAGEPPLERSCGQEEVASVVGLRSHRTAMSSLVPLAASQFVVLAVDTDNELMSQKFGNDTTAASNYIASLVAGMSTIYERDVPVRILQGYTVLRVSSTADPYQQSGNGNADGAKLNEFGEYWRTNYGSIRRTIATLISGKQSNPFASSGIAWLDALCNNGTVFNGGTFGGYSFFQVFKYGGATASDDLLVVAHEIGHNFGSPHTHCYADPKPDTCFAGESCYGGATSCPPMQTYNGVSARGTLMSYCHLLGGCSAGLVFHPSTVSRYMAPALAAASCDSAIGPAAPAITSLSTSTGTTLGGTILTVTGSGFQNGATVAFSDLTGSTAATLVVFHGPTNLTVTTPAHSAGTVDVVVMNPDSQTATLRGGFTFGSVLSVLPSLFYALTPCRMLDTRNSNGALGGPALAAGATRTFSVAGICGIPPTASALSTNVTVTQPAAAGDLVLFPAGTSTPNASTISFSAGLTRANNGSVLVSSDATGSFSVTNRTAGTVHLIVDVNGYFQ